MEKETKQFFSRLDKFLGREEEKILKTISDKNLISENETWQNITEIREASDHAKTFFNEYTDR